MRLPKMLFFVFMLLFVSISNAQSTSDSLILLNGRVYRGAIQSNANGIIKLNEIDKNGNTFTSEFEAYRVFSFTQDGTETVVYKQDEFKDNYLTIPEAKNATLGSYDARMTFKPRVVFWSSLALGYGASIYDTYLQQKSVESPEYIGPYDTGGFFKSRPSLLPFFVPAVLTVSWSIPSFKLKEKQMIQMNLLNDESYYRGYHRVAKQKRMLAALRGSLIGIGAGLITYGIFKP